MLPNRAEISSLFKYFFAFLGIIAFSLLFQQNVSAAVRCETQYGGTQVCVTTGQLQVDKEVFDPQNKKYVDNLGINDYKFSPGELISFRISIKNVGDATLGNIAVTDIPQAGFLDLVTGALNFNLTNLAPGETRQQELKLRVVDESKLPQNNVICIINAAEASADSNKDRDTAQLCLERKVLGVQAKELPRTGLPVAALALVGLVPLGFKLKRYAANYKSEEGNANYIHQMREFLKGGGEIK